MIKKVSRIRMRTIQALASRDIPHVCVLIKTRTLFDVCELRVVPRFMEVAKQLTLGKSYKIKVSSYGSGTFMINKYREVDIP